jgi:hypothetical protein
MNAATLLEKCRSFGATFIPMNDRFKVRAPEPLPEELITELRRAKSEIIAELRHESKIRGDCWLLEEWRRISLPEWRKILQVSIETGNANREQYARWMLREVLDDPEYKEKE